MSENKGLIGARVVFTQDVYYSAKGTNGKGEQWIGTSSQVKYAKGTRAIITAIKNMPLGLDADGEWLLPVLIDGVVHQIKPEWVLFDDSSYDDSLQDW